MINFLISIALFCGIHTAEITKDIKLNEVTYSKGIYKYRNQNLNGHIVDYYENEQLKFRYTVVDGRLHGAAWEFYPSGELKAERNYTFGKLFGDYTIYFTSGTKKLEMEVKENVYGMGEKIIALKIATKEGKKLKSKGEAILIFQNDKGQALKSSELLAIEEQFAFTINQKGKIIYSNL